MLGMMIVVAGFVHATASVAELEEATPSSSYLVIE
jgi:hypothetical protein